MQPVAVKALLTVVVPVDAPKETAVAAPPMLRVVAFALKRLAVPAVVVRDPPLIAALPAAVNPPFDVISPLSATVNSVIPEAEAVRISSFSC